jgi:hypothetical protein
MAARLSVEEQTLPKMIGLHLTAEPSQAEIVPLTAPRDGSQLRYAFMALLAMNIFFVSGAACFVILYFIH